jgi:hypothetical protein
MFLPFLTFSSLCQWLGMSRQCIAVLSISVFGANDHEQVIATSSSISTTQIKGGNTIFYPLEAR